MDRILLILAFNLLADAANPCITWEMTPDKLDITCRLDNIFLPVSIYDMLGKTQGKCEFKDSIALCSSGNKHANITANCSKGELKLAITNVTRSLVKGEWSCIQGTHTFKTLISPSAGIIFSTEVELTGQISHQNSIKTVNLSCFSCREPHRNNVEFLMNHHSVVNVRYDNITKKCLQKDGECRPDRCSCSNSGNLFTYSFEYADNTTEIIFSCGMIFVDKLIATRFSKFSSVIYDGKEFKNNGSETVIIKAPDKTAVNHDRSNNDTDSSTILPVKENNNFNGIQWIVIGTVVAIITLLIVVIVCCRLSLLKERKELLRSSNTEGEEIKQPFLKDNNRTISVELNEHEESLFKLMFLILNIAEKVIKKVISCRLLTNDQSFMSYLNDENSKHVLFHAWHNNKRCCRCKTDDNVQKESMLTKKQFQSLFNNSGSVPQSHVHITDSKMYCLNKIAVDGNVSLDVLDLSVAYCLIVCGVNPETVPDITARKSLLYWMKKIKDKANEIFHIAALGYISDDAFTDKWQTIQEALIKLADLVNPHFCKEILEDIKVLKNETLGTKIAYSAMLTEVLVQSNQDSYLKINQLCEERFMAKLKEAKTVTDNIQNTERNILIKIGEISVKIAEYPVVKAENYQDRNTLDVLLRFDTPTDWNEDEIMEMIRHRLPLINSKGNINIKETTLENFMLIVKMKIRTLIEEEILKNEIKDFFQFICQQCNIDITQPNTVEISIETLATTDDIDVYAQDGEGKSAMEIVLKNDGPQYKSSEIATGQDDPDDDSNVYATSFHTKLAQLVPAIVEDFTDNIKLEVKEESDFKRKPVPKPRLSLMDAGLDEDRKSARYTKPDKNRNDDSPMSVTSISPPKPASRESKTMYPEPKFKQHYQPNLLRKEIDSIPASPPKTDCIPLLQIQLLSSTADMVVADSPAARDKRRQSLDGNSPRHDESVDSAYTGPSLEDRPSEVELVSIRSFFIQKGKDAFLTSCAVWSNSKYIIIDRNNALLLMYNHTTGDIQSENLRNEPFSMAIIDNKNVAISFPERQEIDIYAFSNSNKFKFREVIKVDGKCYTLTEKDNGTLLVYIDGKGIHSFNMSKKELKSLDIRIPSFAPYSDDICARNNRLYHTSRSSGSVFCYDMNGSMLWNFVGDIKRPTALTCDEFGNVYVADYTSHHLDFISADGKSYKTLLSRKEKLWFPTFVYYCMNRKCLLIVNRDNGYAACYSVNYKQ